MNDACAADAHDQVVGHAVDAAGKHLIVEMNRLVDLSRAVAAPKCRGFVGVHGLRH